jgi:hypothetical protein
VRRARRHAPGQQLLQADSQRIWLDWQMVRKAILRDVEYFLVSSLDVDERRGRPRPWSTTARR